MCSNPGRIRDNFTRICLPCLWAVELVQTTDFKRKAAPNQTQFEVLDTGEARQADAPSLRMRCRVASVAARQQLPEEEEGEERGEEETTWAEGRAAVAWEHETGRGAGAARGGHCQARSSLGQVGT